MTAFHAQTTALVVTNLLENAPNAKKATFWTLKIQSATVLMLVKTNQQQS
jgi:hypothetical protein